MQVKKIDYHNTGILGIMYKLSDILYCNWHFTAKRLSKDMEAKPAEIYLYDYNLEDFMKVDKNNLLEQLQEEAERCNRNGHTEAEVTAAIGMVLMYYQAVSEAQFTPKNKPIQQNIASINRQELDDGIMADQPNPNNIVIGTVSEGKHQMRRNRKSNSRKSSLLASCRNILKEFLSQNGMS